MGRSSSASRSNISGACSTRSARGPAIPRTATPKPVALATTPISAAILVPSANEVIILGRCPTASANARCVSGRPAMVQEALDVAGEDRPKAEQGHLVDQVHDHGWLVAGHVGEDHAGRVRSCLQEGSQRRVELSIDEHEVLAGVDGLDRDTRTELDLAGGFHDDIDLAGVRQQRGVVGHGRATSRDRRRKGSRPVHSDEIIDPAIAIRALGLRDRAVRDRHDAHAGRPSQHARNESTTGKAGTDHPDSDRVSRGGALLEGAQDGAHADTSRARSGHARSLSDTMTSSAIGHSMPRAGSSQRMPRSAPGTYGWETW